MSKRGSKASPNTPRNEVGELVENNSLAEVKKFSRWKTVEVKIEILKDGREQFYLIGDGVPYAFWIHTYQNLEMTRAHASKVLKKLIPEKEVIVISKLEMRQFYPTVNAALTVKYKLHEYNFITDYGYNRTILEISTGGMKDREVAARIELRKDEMAAVFTKFKRGELSPSDSDFNIDSFDTSRKGMSSLNGIRIRLQGMLAKQRHPSNPDTVRRKIDMFRRDHRVMKGHDNMEKGWRNKESDDNKVKLTGWMAFGIYSFARGHLEPDEQTRDLKEFYSTCPELKPDYMPDKLESTKQLKLLVEGEES